MVSILMAYTETKYITEKFLEVFENEFKGKYE